MRDDELGGGGSAGAGGAPADAGADAQADAAPPCTAWAVASREPVELTDPIGDSSLTGAALEGNRVFVASTNNNDPSPDPTWRVSVVSDDLATIGPSQIVLSRPQSVSFSGLSVASRSGHRGGIAWDTADGCRFVALADDGSAASAPLTLGGAWCYWLIATSSGFVAFSSPSFELAPLTLLTLDPSGNIVGTKPDLVPQTPETTFPLARARLDDGSIWLAWANGPSVTLQRFSEAGDVMTPPKDVLPFDAGTVFSMAPLGSTLLVAWTPGDAVPGQVLAQPIDGEGDPIGAPSEVAPPHATAIGDVEVAAAGGAALVAWTEGASGAYHAMTLQPVTVAGAPEGAPIAVPTPQFIGTVRLVGTPAGALLLFEAQKPQTLTQVFAMRLVCSG